VGISTHVLDTTRGRPASGVAVSLSREQGGAWTTIGQGATDADGRCKTLCTTEPPVGTYRIRFEVGAYFAQQKVDAFYPHVTIDFQVRASNEHYHVPLLLNPFGYSTYRGS
jgi:5-hydroxyisourate hydrolase